MKVAVIFGGRSCEHDISIITAVQTMNNINDFKYDVYPIYMKDGNFYYGSNLKNINFFINCDLKKCIKLNLINGAFVSSKKGIKHFQLKPDVALICCHGGEGENGILQGLLEYNDIPYTSAKVGTSSICMDKIITKQLVNGMMLNATNEISFNRVEYKDDPLKIIRHIETYLDYPIIVKPANLGSSIGIKRCDDRDELMFGIEVALNFDRRIICEKALINFIELNCACVSDGNNIVVSEVERPKVYNNFLSFDDKYMNKNGMKGEERELPAKINENIYELVKKTTLELYKELDMAGVVRVDYLLSDDNKLYINEINTIPGSLAFYLFEPLGITFSCLIDMIIDGALKYNRDKSKSNLVYNSSVLRKLVSSNLNHLPKYH